MRVEPLTFFLASDLFTMLAQSEEGEILAPVEDQHAAQEEHAITQEEPTDSDSSVEEEITIRGHPSSMEKLKKVTDELEILLFKVEEALENEMDEAEVEKLKKRILCLEQRRDILKKLQDLKSTRIEQLPKLQGAQKVTKEWKVPTNLPLFRGLKGISDPLDFIEQFERVCIAHGIQEDRYIKLIPICLNNIDAHSGCNSHMRVMC